MSNSCLKPSLVRSLLKMVKPGKFFTVRFIKADGQERVMNCRQGVKKYLKGGQSSISQKKNLVPVFDVKVGDYRCFDINRVLELRANKVSLAVNI